MDWQNEDSDQSSVENLKWDENDHPVTRTKDAAAAVVLDRNVCSQGVQVEIGPYKNIRNFTSALKNLELETNDRDPPELKTNDAQTDYFNDSEQEENVPVFKTREISTFQLVIQGMEILNFQGTRHSPAEIAPYWKKDSRMWLWKSVRLARKRTKGKAPASTLYREDLS
ncbi:PiggyBac transposable element-derived protein domain-containing protein [Camponotus japonicus]